MKSKSILIVFGVLLSTALVKLDLNFIYFLKIKYVLWVFSIAILSICAIFIRKKRYHSFIIHDIVATILLILGIVNYIFLGDVSVYNIKIWYYIGYIYTYILFRQLLQHTKNNSMLLKQTLVLLVFFALVNASIGILQFLEIVQSKNKHFKVIGLFHSPNHLGLTTSLGALSCLALLKQYSFKFYATLTIYFFIFLLFGVLLLTESRGALLALVCGTGYLLYDKQKIKDWYQKTNKLSIIVFCGLLMSLSTISAFFLYNNNPDSVFGRYFSLKICSKEIVKNPLGTGINSFAKAYNTAKAAYFEIPRNWQETKHATFIISAFNDLAELTLEMGIVWMLFFGFLISLLFNRILNNTIMKTPKALLVLLGIFACTNTIIVLPFFCVIFIFYACVLIQNQKRKLLFLLPNNKIIKILKLTPLVVLLIVMAQRVQAETQLINLKDGKNKVVDFKKIHTAIHRINHIGKPEFYVWNELRKKKFTEKSLRYLDTAFQKSAMPKMGRLLAIQYAKQGKLSKAIKIFNYNKNVEPYRYEARMDLLGIYNRQKDIRNTLKLAREIKKFPVKIPSKKIEKYKTNAGKYIKAYGKYKTDSTLYGFLSRGLIYNSKILNKKIPYKFYLPPLSTIEKKLPVLYVNDGSKYIKSGKLVRKVDSLIRCDKISPIMVVFIDPKDRNKPKEESRKIRQELYLCNDLYTQFLMNELLPLIEEKHPASEKERSILGLSFGGLSAAYTAIKEPQLFKNILLQSPAFRPRKEIYNLYKNAPKHDFDIYINYGTGRDTEKQDVPFIKILKNKNYNLTVKVVPNGNHDWENWEKQLNDVLLKYFEK